jgi:beta-N-acetylhexosaminidase
MTNPLRNNSSFAVATAALIALGGCGVFRSAADPSPPVVVHAPAEPEPPRIEPVPVPAPGVASAGAEPIAIDPDPAAAAPVATSGWPERTLAGMTLRRKVGQMMMPWALGDFTPAGSVGETRLRQLVEEDGVGGLIVSVGSPTEVAVKLNELQLRAGVPLLVAADLESGAGFRLRGAVHLPTNIELGGATEFPSLMAVGATGEPRLAYEMGRVTAQEARAVGIHVPFAPVLDVNNNPDNPIINVRSFGEDPEQVARMGASFVRGIEENGGLATGKHFPGHGDTGVDSHQSLPLISAPRARLDSVELVPFRYAIAAGIGGIMTGHISVPALEDGGTAPATLSPQVMTGVLRGELGFGGLLFTDAMDMGAIDRGVGREEAPVRAVLAGADVILMPPSVPQAIDAIVAAVESGRITEARIDQSVLRILRAKERLGLAADPLVDPARVHRAVGIPEHVDVARAIAEQSLVLLKNERRLLPLTGTPGARVMSISFRRSAADLLAGRYFNEQLRQTYAGLLVESTDRNTPEPVWDLLEREARRARLVVVSVYVTAWDAGAIPERLEDFIEELADRRIPHVVVSFGNPYLLRRFPDAQTYLLAWSGAVVSQRAAARALVGEIPITGRTPTRIPPDFDIGAGIALPARAAP